MERADFIYQIFFDKMELEQKISSDIIMSYKLFSLPLVEVDRINASPGTINISQGKRMLLKIPQIELIDYCPLELVFRIPRPGHTSVGLAHSIINLQYVFERSLQEPNRYVQRKFVHQIKDKKGGNMGVIVFYVSVCYTSSSAQVINAPPIVLDAGEGDNHAKNLGGDHILDNDSDKSKAKSNKNYAVRATEYYERTGREPLIPVIPETRKRSIFYFDKGDLLEENRMLSDEITRLTSLVSKLKDVVERYETHGSLVKSARKGQDSYVPKNKRYQQTSGGRADFIYHPPGLNTQRRRTFV